jgi:hypothetical protein
VDGVTGPDMSQMAVDYATAGAEVLPLHTPGGPTGCSCRRRGCPHIGKHPRTLHGLADATSDLEEVKRWWTMWPDANVGIRPHPGHVVLDVDPRNGGAVQLVAMQDRYGRLPATRTAATGGGGWHLWFQFTGDTVKELAPGLDIKTHDGYIVAPPSRHASGWLYEWTNPGEIVEAPPYLARLIARPPVKVRTATGQLTDARIAGLLRVVTEATPNRDRNNRLYWACARGHEAGGDVAPLIEAAVANGLDRTEAEKTAKSAENAPPLRPRRGVA